MDLQSGERKDKWHLSYREYLRAKRGLVRAQGLVKNLDMKVEDLEEIIREKDIEITDLRSDSRELVQCEAKLQSVKKTRNVLWAVVVIQGIVIIATNR